MPIRKHMRSAHKTYYAIIVLLALYLFPNPVHTQNLVVEGFAGMNNTKYDFSYTNNSRYLNFGGRIAGGLHKLQIGIEYSQDLIPPELDLEVSGIPFGSDEISSRYLGLFLRSKLCRYPAARFGLVLRGGIGVYDSKLTFTDAVVGQQYTYNYDKYPGANAGIGFSFPFGKYAMIEASYNIYYSKRPEIPNLRQAYTATYHAIQLGVSYNLVFGAVKDNYTEIIKRKYGG